MKLLILPLLLLMSLPASADKVRHFCKNDYLTYCGHTKPYSPECKSCMRSNLARLSMNCKMALKGAGYRR